MGEDHRLSGAAGAGGEPLNSELMPSSVLLELLDSFIEVVEVAFVVVGLVGTGFEEEAGAEEEEEDVVVARATMRFACPTFRCCISLKRSQGSMRCPAWLSSSLYSFEPGLRRSSYPPGPMQ